MKELKKTEERREGKWDGKARKIVSALKILCKPIYILMLSDCNTLRASVGNTQPNSALIFHNWTHGLRIKQESSSNGQSTFPVGSWPIVPCLWAAM